MITKINKLKDFGIFKDFAWNGLDEFKKKNLIYGWNYSGKTTLSKFFQNLEFKDNTKNFTGSEFSLSTKIDETTTNYNQNSIDTFPHYVKVFNSNYINRIFTFDGTNSDIQPISFYLGDSSGDLDKEIKKLETKTEQLENIKDNRYQKIVNEFNIFNKASGKFTDKAKEIRENYLDNKLNQTQLNKGVIKDITDSIKSDLGKYILSDSEKDITKVDAVSDNILEIQKDDFNFTESLKTLADEVKSILEDTAPKSIPFPELDENKALFDWVQTGIKLHEGATECKFCTKTLPENRISDLNSYYSKKLQEIQASIKNVQEKINAERRKLSISFPDKINLKGAFHKDYQKTIDNYNETRKKYEAQLNILEDDLKRKTSDYFNNITASHIDEISFENDFEEINKILKAHNDWLLKFDKNKSEALKKILNHYIAEFLISEDYINKEKDKDRALTIIDDIKSRISNNNIKRLKLKAKLKSIVKGQEELNDTLTILLHRDDIRIEIKSDKFTLERSGFPASNLSEGEKSAIAFAYFLTELKEMQNDKSPKLPNTIVFIDDPISSLDSNHIFQIRLLLNNFFKNNDFAQLFISTHNFEFFSVMLDTNLFGGKSKDQNGNKRPLYFIKRNDDNSSIIKKLPKVFSSYKSEYVGLFHTIKEYNDLENKEDFSNLLILPNAVRRFLELYTLMKYPSNSEVDVRVKAVFNPKDKPMYNTKLLHWFSHQNQFEKIQQHDGKLLQMEEVVKELMEYIKLKDELHWKGLIGE